VGGYSCLTRLVGLLLNWVSLVYRSSMFASFSRRHHHHLLLLPIIIIIIIIILILYIHIPTYIHTQDCFCPLQNIRSPKLASHFTSVPLYPLFLSSSEYSIPEVGQPLHLCTRCFCPLQNIRAPKLASHFTSVPADPALILTSGNLSISLEDTKYLCK
jgi:hypothetical protein